MKKHNWFWVLVLMMTSATCWGQNFHDMEIEELKGHVKSCSWGGDGASVTRHFTEDGKYDEPDISETVYNDNGYLVSCNVDNMGELGKETIQYNENNQVVKVVLTMGKGTMVSEFTYNGDGSVKTEKNTVSLQGVSKSMTITYTYMTFDNRGNWIRRVGKVGDQCVQQIRAITYW